MLFRRKSTSLEFPVDFYGWEPPGRAISVRCKPYAINRLLGGGYRKENSIQFLERLTKKGQTMHTSRQLRPSVLELRKDEIEQIHNAKGNIHERSDIPHFRWSLSPLLLDGNGHDSVSTSMPSLLMVAGKANAYLGSNERRETNKS